MNDNFTIAYMTNRKSPRFKWFADHLANRGCSAEILIIDFYADERDLSKYAYSRGLDARSHTPKPTVWQGKHRITKENHFAAANARNTAVCLAKHDYIVFADDLSVPGHYWLDRVREHARDKRVVFGAYAKLLGMEVIDGDLKGYEGYASNDHRLVQHPQFGPTHGAWLYGCSFGLPIDVMLKINGMPEIADGMGYEDTVTGEAIVNNGIQVFFDPTMMTFESEEAHHEDKSFIRTDPGVSPNDKSHAFLNMCKGLKRFDNYFGPEGLAGLRARIQAGGEFPAVGIPEHEWFTGTPLRDL
jgi:hypothetical protein